VKLLAKQRFPIAFPKPFGFRFGHYKPAIPLISFSTFAVFTLGSLVIIISPGPDFLYVSARGISQGRQAGLISATGVCIGLLIHTLLAALGLSALLKTSGLAFNTVKIIGALYLFYMGIKVFMSKDSLVQKNGVMMRTNRLAVLREAVATNVFNPKAILTFMAYIPQFIRGSDQDAGAQLVFLGLYFSFLAILWFGVVGYCAGFLGDWLSRRVAVQRCIRWLTSLILIGLGVRLAATKNK